MSEEKDKMHIVQVLAEQAGLNCRSYSGRGMYGAECLGIVHPIAGVIFGDIVRGIDMSVDPSDGSMHKALIDVADAFYSARMDSMGRDVIVYFPDIPYVNDEDESEEG
jgi:hypothetical protein